MPSDPQNGGRFEEVNEGVVLLKKVVCCWVHLRLNAKDRSRDFEKIFCVGWHSGKREKFKVKRSGQFGRSYMGDGVSGLLYPHISPGSISMS